MEENAKRRQSVFENVVKMCEQSTRRRSMFEKSDEVNQKENNTNSYLEEWEQRWGKYGTDFVNVVKYAEGYMQKIQAEEQIWLNGFKEMMEKAEEFVSESECVQIVEGCELSSDRKAILKGIDSKISHYSETWQSHLVSLEVLKTTHEQKLDDISREMELVEKLISFQNK